MRTECLRTSSIRGIFDSCNLRGLSNGMLDATVSPGTGRNRVIFRRRPTNSYDGVGDVRVGFGPNLAWDEFQPAVRAKPHLSPTNWSILPEFGRQRCLNLNFTSGLTEAAWNWQKADNYRPKHFEIGRRPPHLVTSKLACAQKQTNSSHSGLISPIYRCLEMCRCTVGCTAGLQKTCRRCLRTRNRKRPCGTPPNTSAKNSESPPTTSWTNLPIHPGRTSSGCPCGVGLGRRSWPERNSINRTTRKARSGTMFRFSGPDDGHGTDSRGPGAIWQIASRRRKLATQATSYTDQLELPPGTHPNQRTQERNE